MKVSLNPTLTKVQNTTKTEVSNIKTPSQYIETKKQIDQLPEFPKSYVTSQISFGNSLFTQACEIIDNIKDNDEKINKITEFDRGIINYDELKKALGVEDSDETFSSYTKQCKLTDENINYKSDVIKLAFPDYGKKSDYTNEEQEQIKILDSYVEAKRFNKEREIKTLTYNKDRALEDCSWFAVSKKKLIKANYQKDLEKLDIKEKAVDAILNNEALIQHILNKKSGLPQSQIDELAKIVNVMNVFNSENAALDERIAGYSVQKKFVKDAIITPLRADSPDKPEIAVPKALLIFGPIGTGKTTFAEAIAQETGARIVESDAPEPKKFAKSTSDLMEDARWRYLMNGQRTIILVNEIDKFLKIHPDNYNNIASMKNWLDYCSKRPEGEESRGNAVTFIFTTNNPMAITDEIRNRYGKIGTPVALPAPDKQDIQEILKFYINKAAQGYEWLRESNSLSDEEKELLANKKQIELEKIKLDNKVKLFFRNQDNAQYSCDKVKNIVESAYKNYINDSTDSSFNYHLTKCILAEKPDIEKERLEEFKIAESKLTKSRKMSIEETKELIEALEYDEDEEDKIKELKEDLAEMEALEANGTYDIYGDEN